jgi:predicted component of type VI protein secretion system
MTPLLIQIEKTEENVADSCAFAKSPVRIGRNPLNDLQLEESFVSQWHAVVRFTDDKTLYLDLGSTNRTTIDGKAVERNVETPVDENSDVRIGTLRLHILRADAPPEIFGKSRKSAFDSGGGSGDPGPLDGTLYLPESSREPRSRSRSEAPTGDVSLDDLDNAKTMLRSGDRAGPPPGLPGTPAAPPRPARPPGLAATPSSPASAGAVPATGGSGTAYETYRAAWDRFFTEIRYQLESVPQDAREGEVMALQQRYPALAHEPEFRDYLSSIGVNPIRAGQPEMQEWLERLTDGLFPPPGMRINVAMAMERVGQILEVFGQGFIELRKAHQQFCDEMSLTRYADHSTLQRTENPSALIAYLLNPGKEGNQRPNELARALADIALHQVALVSATVEGGRALLDTIHPKALKDGPEPPRSSPALAEEEGALDRLWPQRARGLWRKYVAQHHDLLEGDRFTREIFGRKFARRYYSITGGTGSDD